MCVILIFKISIAKSVSKIDHVHKGIVFLSRVRLYPNLKVGRPFTEHPAHRSNSKSFSTKFLPVILNDQVRLQIRYHKI